MTWPPNDGVSGQGASHTCASSLTPPSLASRLSPAALGGVKGGAGQGAPTPEQGLSGDPSLLHLKGTQTNNCLETRLPVNN